MKGVAMLVKLVAIAAVAIVGFFGAQEAFHFAGTPATSPVGNEGFTIPGTNETIEPPRNNVTAFDVRGWVYDFPLKDIIDLVVSGVGGFVNWVSEGVYAAISWLIHLVFPSVTLPVWMGMLVVVLLMVIVLYFSWQSLWEKGHTLSTWAVVIMVALFIMIAVLSILGLVPK